MGLKDLLFGSYSKKELKRIDPIAQQVYALEDEYRKKTDEELRQTTVSLREKLAGGATLDEMCIRDRP